MPIESTIQKGNEKELTSSKTPAMCTYLLYIYVGTFSMISSTTQNGTIVEFYTTTCREQQLQKYFQAAIYTLNWIESNLNCSSSQFMALAAEWKIMG